MSITWISSLILASPALFAGDSYKYDDASFFCTPNFNKTFAVCYSFVYTTLVFIVPLVLILMCNVKVSTVALHEDVSGKILVNSKLSCIYLISIARFTSVSSFYVIL